MKIGQLLNFRENYEREMHQSLEKKHLIEGITIIIFYLYFLYDFVRRNLGL